MCKDPKRQNLIFTWLGSFSHTMTPTLASNVSKTTTPEPAKVALQVKALDANLGDLNLILTGLKERISFCQLASDLHTCAMVDRHRCNLRCIVKTQESHFSFPLPVCSLHLSVLCSTFPHQMFTWLLFCSPSFTLPRRGLLSSFFIWDQTKLSVPSNSTRKIQQRKKIR